MAEEKEYTLEELEELIEKKQLVEVRAYLSEQNEVDIAVLLGELPIDKLSIAFRILPKELAADTFAHLESDVQLNLIKAFSDNELNYIIRH